MEKIEAKIFVAWLDSAQIFFGFVSIKIRLGSARTFCGSAFAAFAPTPRSKHNSLCGAFLLCYVIILLSLLYVVLILLVCIT